MFNVSRLHGDNSFQAGTYYLHKNLGVKDAVKALQKRPHIDYVVLRVPPGLWMTQIAERVGRLGGRAAAPFLQDTHNNSVRSVFEPQGVTNLEGLVRPDTYNISGSQDEISVLQTMVTASTSTRSSGTRHGQRRRPHRTTSYKVRVADRGGGEGPRTGR